MFSHGSGVTRGATAFVAEGAYFITASSATNVTAPLVDHFALLTFGLWPS